MTKRTPVLVRSGQNTYSSPARFTNFHLLALATAMTLAIVLVIVFTVQYFTKPAYSRHSVSGVVTSVDAVPVQTAANIVPVADVISTPAARAPVESSFFDYPVKKNDVLIRIARSTCNDYLEIAANNHIANPDNIYPNQLLKLKKVEHCTPETAKLKASPEVHNTPRVVAPRDKLFVPVPAARAGVAATPSVSNGNCDTLGSRIRDEMKRIVFRADCIMKQFGEHINAQVASGKTAVLAKAGLTLSQAKHLIIAITLEESKGNTHAVCIPRDESKAKSEGLMQLTPDTMARFGGGNPFNPAHNYRAGYGALTTYAALFVGLPHAIERTLIGYHIGPYDGREGKRKFLYRESFDPRGDGYVRRVLRNYSVLEAQSYASLKSTGIESISDAAKAAN